MAWNETIIQLHTMLGTLNKCWIVNCGRPTEVIVRERRTENENFYCQRCANELTTTFPRLFVEVGK